MSEHRLIVTVGLPKSGKTTWARAQSYPIVNPDAIRLALHGIRFYPPAEPFVWAIAYLMVDALWKAGHETVIVDACNNTAKRRKEWTDRFLNIMFQFFPASAEVCTQRAHKEGDLDIIPVIERMAKESDWRGT